MDMIKGRPIILFVSFYILNRLNLSQFDTKFNSGPLIPIKIPVYSVSTRDILWNAKFVTKIDKGLYKQKFTFNSNEVSNT